MPKFREPIAQKSAVNWNPSPPNPLSPKPNVVEYLADTGGCGHWRMLWPAHAMILQEKAFIEHKNRLIHLPEYYHGVNVIRIQRQANPALVKPYEALANAKSKVGYRMVYESDDIIFKDDLPEYNGAGAHFNENSTKAAMDIIGMCDEITVSTPFLADYYRQKTGHQKVTVVPNYAPKTWLGRYTDPIKVLNKFDRHSQRLRILYAGSPCHVNHNKHSTAKDDFSHVVDMIAKTSKEFKWVFFGTIPHQLKPLADAGEVEYYPWVALQEYPSVIEKLDVNLSIAPLIDNVFNRAKSNIKYLEAACMGIPCICQDICTYEDANLKFNSADELLETIRSLKDKNVYERYANHARHYADKMWLEDNTDKLLEVYQYPFGSNMRIGLSTIKHSHDQEGTGVYRSTGSSGRP